MRTVVDLSKRSRDIINWILFDFRLAILIFSALGFFAAGFHSATHSQLYKSTAIVRKTLASPVESLTRSGTGVLPSLSPDTVSVNVARQLIGSIESRGANLPLLEVKNPLDLSVATVAERVRRGLTIRSSGEVYYLSFVSPDAFEAKHITMIASRAFLRSTSSVGNANGQESFQETLERLINERRILVAEHAGTTSLDDVSAHLTVIDQEIEVLENLLNRVDEKEISPYHIVQEASLPTEPLNRSIYANLLAGMLLFGFIGGTLSVGYRRLQPYVHTPEDLGKKQDYEWIGTLPAYRRAMVSRKAHVETHRLTELIPTPKARSHPLVSLLLAIYGRTRSPRTVYVTSPDRREGKTTIAWSLANLLARTGRRTLLIESDSVGQPIAKHLKSFEEVGLLDVLWGTTSLSHVIQSTKHPQLFFIPSGRSHDGIRPVQRELKFVLELLQRDFEFILIDGQPGGGAVADIDVLRREVEGVLMIVGAGTSLKKTVAEQKLTLRENQLLFTLVNKVDTVGIDGRHEKGWYLRESGRQEVSNRDKSGMAVNNSSRDLDRMADIGAKLDELLSPYRSEQGGIDQNTPVSL